MNKGAVKFFEEKIRYEIDPYSVRHIVDEKDKNHVIVDVRDVDSYKKGMCLQQLMCQHTNLINILKNCQKIKN
ncbi:hypothetical protein J4448_05325 [Candidatus Woesearchaeota archaeon]|nr:hypothetical protein [Candidatus Woesearchaeota archaeon]